MKVKNKQWTHGTYIFMYINGIRNYIVQIVVICQNAYRIIMKPRGFRYLIFAMLSRFRSPSIKTNMLSKSIGDHRVRHYYELIINCSKTTFCVKLVYRF